MWQVRISAVTRAESSSIYVETSEPCIPREANVLLITWPATRARDSILIVRFDIDLFKSWWLYWHFCWYLKCAPLRHHKMTLWLANNIFWRFRRDSATESWTRQRRDLISYSILFQFRSIKKWYIFVSSD